MSYYYYYPAQGAPVAAQTTTCTTTTQVTSPVMATTYTVPVAATGYYCYPANNNSSYTIYNSAYTKCGAIIPKAVTVNPRWDNTRPVTTYPAHISGFPLASTGWCYPATSAAVVGMVPVAAGVRTVPTVIAP